MAYNMRKAIRDVLDSYNMYCSAIMESQRKYNEEAIAKSKITLEKMLKDDNDNMQ